MTDSDHINDSVVSRRQYLVPAATAILTGGAVVAFGSSGRASASVEVSPLDIEDASVTGDDGTVSDVELTDVSGNYQFTAEHADEIALELLVAPEPDSDDWVAIDSMEEPAMAASTSGSYAMSGSVLAHPGISADEFDAEPGETTERDVPIRVVLDVIAGGEIQVSAVAETVATATVENTAVAVSAEVTGSGQMEIAV